MTSNDLYVEGVLTNLRESESYTDLLLRNIIE